MSDITQKVAMWRQKALKEVQAIRSKKKRITLAREFYEIDQSAMNDGTNTHTEWPEMKDIAEQQIRKSPAKRKRDDLVTARSTCQQVTYYKKSWNPTLEEYSEEYPLDE